jgi:hypothetical protein
MLAFLLLSRENRWSSKSHHACMFGRVVTEVNAVKIRLMGQIFRAIFCKDTVLCGQSGHGHFGQNGFRERGHCSLYINKFIYIIVADFDNAFSILTILTMTK